MGRLRWRWWPCLGGQRRSRRHCLTINLDCAFDQMLDLVESQWTINAEARLESCPSAVLDVLLHLSDFVSGLFDCGFAHPTSGDLGPAVSFKECKGRLLIGIGSDDLIVDVLPVMSPGAQSPWNFEFHVVIFFFGFYCSRCLHW